MIFEIEFETGLRDRFIADDLNPMSTFSLYPASSDANDFIPYHALLSGKLVHNGNEKTLIYSLDVKADAEYKTKNHEDFFYRMGFSRRWYTLVKKNISQDYRARAGQLVEVLPSGEIVLLATVVVNKAHLFNINKAYPDYSQFFIAVDGAFAYSERHSNLYKTFTKYYLDMAMRKVDVIYTKSIINLCYKHLPVMKLKPKTIAEAKTINQTVTSKLVKDLMKHAIY